MLERSLIGRESEPVLHEVEKGQIRRFAEALGDPNPLALDEAAAKAAGYTGLVAPPTFAVTLTGNERFRHSLDLGTRSILLGEQQIELNRPIVAGDRKVWAIAAASILAKVHRDRLMAEYALQYPGYGFEMHKGYGTEVHRAAIRARGYCPEHRRTFHSKELMAKN